MEEVIEGEIISEAPVELTAEELKMPEEGVAFKPVLVRGELVDRPERLQELVVEKEWVDNNPTGVSIGVQPAE